MAKRAQEPRAESEPDPVAEPDATALPAVPAAIPSVDGWYGDAEWIRVECDWDVLRPRAGAQPLWAELDATLTIREAMSIPLGIGLPLSAVLPHIVHRVRAWNVHEYDPATGTMVPVPPPAEGGIDSFTRCRPVVVEWLTVQLQQLSLGGGPNRKNGTTPSGDGPSGESVAG